MPPLGVPISNAGWCRVAPEPNTGGREVSTDSPGSATGPPPRRVGRVACPRADQLPCRKTEWGRRAAITRASSTHREGVAVKVPLAIGRAKGYAKKEGREAAHHGGSRLTRVMSLVTMEPLAAVAEGADRSHRGSGQLLAVGHGGAVMLLWRSVTDCKRRMCVTRHAERIAFACQRYAQHAVVVGLSVRTESGWLDG